MMRAAQMVLALAHVVESGGINGGSGNSANSTPSPPSSPSRHPPRSRPSILTPSSSSKLSLESSNGTGSSPVTSTGNPLWFDTGSTKVWAGSAAQQAALRGTLTGKRRSGNEGASASTPNLLLAPPTSGAAAASAGSNSPKAKREALAPPVIPILTGRRGSLGAGGQGLTSGSASVTMSPSSSLPSPTTQTVARSPPHKHISLSSSSPASQPHPPPRSSARVPPTGPRVPVNRTSIASTATSATTTSATDSIFDSPTSGGGGPRSRWDKFGSVRTNVTNLTGITVPSSGGVPSLSRSEARDAVKEMAERDVFGEEKWTSAARTTNDSNDTIHNLPVPSTSGRRDRRSSELATELVRVVEEDDESMPNQGARHLRRLVIPPARNSPSHSSPSRIESEDVLTIDDDGPLTPPPKTNSREQGRAYSPSYASRSLMKQDQPPGGHYREASPSPARIGGTSGLSSSPSRRQNGRLVPKGASSANSSGYLSPRNRGSGELGFFGNESTSSLVDSPISPSPLLPASHESASPVPIPFPQRQSNDMMKAGGKSALGRVYGVSASPIKPFFVDSVADPRPTVRRSRILSDTTANGGDGSLRDHPDRALSDGPNDLKAGRRARFESMIDVSTSRNMREGTIGEGGLGTAAVHRTLVVKEPGQPAVHYVCDLELLFSVFRCLIET